MTEPLVVVVGAGPAGLAAAATAAQAGLRVRLLDDQVAPGGQIYRGVEGASAERRSLLGEDYAKGAGLVAAARREGIEHLAGASLWQVSRERELHYTREGRASVCRADYLILATGAMERPMPFPGWTLPGVLTAGAGQILLKSGGLVPQGRVVLAGSGPLLYLLAQQYRAAGLEPAAVVETTPKGRFSQTLGYLPGAIREARYLIKGLKLLRSMRGIPCHQGASELRAEGDGSLERLSFTAGGKRHELACDLLLIHQGVVPNVQITRALDLRHDWDSLQRCWRPRLDAWGETEIEGIAVAGDGGGIGGAEIAALQGRLAGLQAAHKLGALNRSERDLRAKRFRRRLKRHQAARPYLDAFYAPAQEFLAPPAETLVCRCEEVTAGQVRDWVKLGCLGPNQTKSFGRPGMGPCQGRFCGLTVSETIAAERRVPVREVGYYRIRPPIKPVTLGELATLGEDTQAAPEHAETP